MRLLLRSYRSPFEVVTAEEAIELDRFGKNVGNLVFSEAAQKILTADDVEVDLDNLRPMRGLAARVNAEYDAFVLPLANAFRPDFEPRLQSLTRLIRRLKVPVVILGVGAQGDIDGDMGALAPIEGSVRDFVGAVLDRAPAIGVRGELTADYLTHLGFRDVEVIGCPSMFRHGPSFPTIRGLDLTPDSAVAVNGSHLPFERDGLDRVALDLRARFARTVYFGQDMPEAHQMRWHDLSSPVGTWTRVPSHPANPYFAGGDARFHVDPRTWIEELSGFDCSIGSRIHGTIAALLAGTPAMVLTADSRTLELCRYFEIPHHRLDDVVGRSLDPVTLLEDADWAPLQVGHAARWERFAGFLRRCGLPNAFEDGDGGRAFEERLAALDLPLPITPTRADELAGARERSAWLSAELLRREAAQRERERAEAAAAAPSAPSGAASAALADEPRRGDRLRRLRRPAGPTPPRGG